MADKLRITLVKSTIGAVPKNKKTVEALGLRKLNKTVDMVQEMVKQQVKAIKVRKHVQALRDQVLKVVRCLYTEDFLREASNVEILKISLQST